MNSAAEILLFLIGGSVGLFVLISLLVLVPERGGSRSERSGPIWLGGPGRSERGSARPGWCRPTGCRNGRRSPSTTGAPSPRPRSRAAAPAAPRRAGEAPTRAPGRRLSDAACRLVAMSTAIAFSVGDIAGGLLHGIAALSEHATARR